jgi:SAM domain (Sterile alpha motif)
MSEYAQRFAENRIDFSVLPDPTDHDLEKLGVVLGDRRKMLRAIANLEAWKIAPVATVATAASTGPSPLDAAERRQVPPINPSPHLPLIGRFGDLYVAVTEKPNPFRPGTLTTVTMYMCVLKQFPAYLNRWDSQQARNEGVFAH